MDFGGGFFGAPGVVKQAKIDVTPAQFKALSGSPITLIAAPNANTILVPLYIVTTLEWISQDYNTLPGYHAIMGNLGQDIVYASLTQAFVNAAANSVFLENLPQSGGFGTLITPLDTTLLGVDIVMQTVNADPLLGDGIFHITIAYIEVVFP